MIWGRKSFIRRLKVLTFFDRSLDLCFWWYCPFWYRKSSLWIVMVLKKGGTGARKIGGHFLVFPNKVTKRSLEKVYRLGEGLFSMYQNKVFSKKRSLFYEGHCLPLQNSVISKKRSLFRGGHRLVLL